MASIDISNVRKNFGIVPVLHGVDLAIENGEFVVLVGPSGCGKSTLLRMIAGLEEVTEGEIRIGGARVNERAPKDRDIAMVFQSYALYPHMNVAENMSYSLRIREGRHARRSRRRSPMRPKSSGCSRCWSGGRRRCRAASASAWRWAAPSCGSRRRSCSMSRCPTSTRVCASRCGPRSRNCIAISARPRSTSPTIRSRR